MNNVDYKERISPKHPNSHGDYSWVVSPTTLKTKDPFRDSFLFTNIKEAQAYTPI